MQRFPFLQALHTVLGDDALVVAAAYTGREWAHIRPDDATIRTRTLGLVSSMALGIALELPNRTVVALDGDGAFLMNLCGLPTIARHKPGNLLHIVFDNGVYEASGNQPTASAVADLMAVGRSCGYARAKWVATPEDMAREAADAIRSRELTMLGVKTDLGGADVPEFQMPELEMKFRFIRHIEKTEKRSILSVWTAAADGAGPSRPHNLERKTT
jgi:thiamine pyrophosphate-dependent acetolactate synthase large subunit-like protein